MLPQKQAKQPREPGGDSRSSLEGCEGRHSATSLMDSPVMGFPVALTTPESGSIHVTGGTLGLSAGGVFDAGSARYMLTSRAYSGGPALAQVVANTFGPQAKLIEFSEFVLLQPAEVRSTIYEEIGLTSALVSWQSRTADQFGRHSHLFVHSQYGRPEDEESDSDEDGNSVDIPAHGPRVELRWRKHRRLPLFIELRAPTVSAPTSTKIRL